MLEFTAVASKSGLSTTPAINFLLFLLSTDRVMSLKYELYFIPSLLIILVGIPPPWGTIQTPSHGLKGQTLAEAEPTPWFLSLPQYLPPGSLASSQQLNKPSLSCSWNLLLPQPEILCPKYFIPPLRSQPSYPLSNKASARPGNLLKMQDLSTLLPPPPPPP